MGHHHYRHRVSFLGRNPTNDKWTPRRSHVLLGFLLSCVVTWLPMPACCESTQVSSRSFSSTPWSKLNRGGNAVLEGSASAYASQNRRNSISFGRSLSARLADSGMPEASHGRGTCRQQDRETGCPKSPLLFLPPVLSSSAWAASPVCQTRPVGCTSILPPQTQERNLRSSARHSTTFLASPRPLGTSVGAALQECKVPPCSLFSHSGSTDDLGKKHFVGGSSLGAPSRSAPRKERSMSSSRSTQFALSSDAMSTGGTRPFPSSPHPTGRGGGGLLRVRKGKNKLFFTQSENCLACLILTKRRGVRWSCNCATRERQDRRLS